MAKERLLIVEDDVTVSELLAEGAEALGYGVLQTGDGREAVAAATQHRPDLVLLDWGIAGISGIEVCRHLRASAATKSIPIILVSGRGEEDDRIHGLVSGADDYVVKPFSVLELFARVRAVLRRSRPPVPTGQLSYRDIEVNLATRRVTRSGRAIELRPREFELLQYLISQPCKVVSRNRLLDSVWGGDRRVDEGTITQAVSRLRRALHIDGLGSPVRTVRSEGYSLDIASARC